MFAFDWFQPRAMTGQPYGPMTLMGGGGGTRGPTIPMEKNAPEKVSSKAEIVQSEIPKEIPIAKSLCSKTLPLEMPKTKDICDLEEKYHKSEEKTPNEEGQRAFAVEKKLSHVPMGQFVQEKASSGAEMVKTEIPMEIPSAKSLCSETLPLEMSKVNNICDLKEKCHKLEEKTPMEEGQRAFMVEKKLTHDHCHGKGLATDLEQKVPIFEQNQSSTREACSHEKSGLGQANLGPKKHAHEDNPTRKIPRDCYKLGKTEGHSQAIGMGKEADRGRPGAAQKCEKIDPKIANSTVVLDPRLNSMENARFGPRRGSESQTRLENGPATWKSPENDGSESDDNFASASSSESSLGGPIGVNPRSFALQNGPKSPKALPKIKNPMGTPSGDAPSPPIEGKRPLHTLPPYGRRGKHHAGSWETPVPGGFSRTTPSPRAPSEEIVPTGPPAPGVAAQGGPTDRTCPVLSPPREVVAEVGLPLVENSV